jgi:GNAT superfamily N-acetyltransferase
MDGHLVGTASWLANADSGETARIACVFVHPLFTRLGLGGRLLAEVEARADQSGYEQLGVSATINAVPFFQRYGYVETSRGVKAFGPECWLPVAFLRKRIGAAPTGVPPLDAP